MIANPICRLLGLATGIAILASAVPAAAQSYVATVNGTDRYSVVMLPTSTGVGAMLKLVPIGSDDCGRTFYLSGALSPNAARTAGTFAGTMVRCTNRDLKQKCDQLGRPIGENYDKPAVGTFKNESYGLMLNVTYQAEKWIKEDCKFEKSATGSDAILITAVSPGGGGPRAVTYSDLVRGVLYNAPGHPLNPNR